MNMQKKLYNLPKNQLLVIISILYLIENRSKIFIKKTINNDPVQFTKIVPKVNLLLKTEFIV
jgi:hypothetical protein